jgi:hypothetical protein
MRHGINATALTVLAVLLGVSTHASVPVPAEVQMALFVNIWKLDRNFNASKPITLAILHQEDYRESETMKDEVVAAVERLKLPIVCVSLEASTQRPLSSALWETHADVVFVTPLRGVSLDQIASICRYRHLRSFAGVPEYVDAGLAVGISVQKDRPVVIINLEQARAEGASFSSQLLALARVVRR